jgi:hypothetical protein
MAEHSLHEAVGDLLKKYADKNDNLKATLDHDCGTNKNGEQKIPLFLGIKSNETHLCCVDALLLKNDDVVAVIEIEEADKEESGFKPSLICGKYLTTALSEQYIHENESDIYIMKDINFIQIVLDKSQNKLDSRKPEQYKNIENAIKEKTLKGNFGCIKTYDLILIPANWKDNPDIFLKKKLYGILNSRIK